MKKSLKRIDTYGHAKYNYNRKRVNIVDNKIFIGAHCGDKKRFPKNVMEGFISVMDFVVDIIEADTRMMRYGECNGIYEIDRTLKSQKRDKMQILQTKVYIWRVL